LQIDANWTSVILCNSVQTNQYSHKPSYYWHRQTS